MARGVKGSLLALGTSVANHGGEHLVLLLEVILEPQGFVQDRLGVLEGLHRPLVGGGADRLLPNPEPLRL
jgi:hypothetical protein